jgi:L-lysine exporter family protein LysE/ArgO
VTLVLQSGPSAAVISGFAFGLSLIVAIGPQNAFMLRQGALREHVATVVVICAASDAILIAVGVAGVGAALGGQPDLMDAARVLGAGLLLVYGVLAARRALARPTGAGADERRESSRAAVIAACLGFTWLNPAVYLDTVVLLGSVANARAGHQWWFGGGATVASILRFAGLGFGAALLNPLLKRPSAWRALDGFVAVIMTATALRILFV